MSSINKIKLPDGNTYDVNDSRIPGVDTTVTSGSSNVVTSGAVASAIPTKVSQLTNDSGYTSNTGTVTSVSAGTGLSIGGTATVNPTVNIASGYKLPSTGEWSNKADLASPALTGTPTAPTATAGTNTTQIATTAFVKTAVDNAVANATHYMGDFTASGDGAITGGSTTLKSVAEKVGDMYVVSTAGTFCGTALEIGDSIIFKKAVAAGTAVQASDLTFVEATVSVSDGNPTLAWGTQSTVGTVEGVALHATLPANPNTDYQCTSSGHYTPSGGSAGTTTAGSAVSWGGAVVTGLTLTKGHVTGITTGTIPSNPNTNTAQLQVSDTTNKRINTAESTGKYIQFTGGTNKFNVSDGTSNFDVSITPSVTFPVTSVNSKTGAVTLTYSDVGAAASSHTHNYAGSSSAGGAATSANKINTDAGSATQPVYFSSGVPSACTYSLGASVPSGAVFTDSKVSQSATTTSNWRKVILSYQDSSSQGASVSSNINVVYGCAEVEVQPSTGTLRADNLRAGNVYVGSASGSQCHQQYDATNKCLKFIFD